MNFPLDLSRIYASPHTHTHTHTRGHRAWWFILISFGKLKTTLCAHISCNALRERMRKMILLLMLLPWLLPPPPSQRLRPSQWAERNVDQRWVNKITTKFNWKLINKYHHEMSHKFIILQNREGKKGSRMRAANCVCVCVFVGNYYCFILWLWVNWFFFLLPFCRRRSSGK